MQTIELILIGLIAVTLCVLAGAVAFALTKIGQLSTRMESTLAEVKTTLNRVEKLAASTESLVDHEIVPTLQVTRATIGHLEVTTRTIRSGVEGVAKIVAVVDTIAHPKNLANVTSGLLRGSGDRIG